MHVHVSSDVPLNELYIKQERARAPVLYGLSMTGMRDTQHEEFNRHSHDTCMINNIHIVIVEAKKLDECVSYGFRLQ